jgi:hypothetical protein
MNDELESQLRRALRPEAPRAGFTERVMARIPARPRLRHSTRWASAALAAAIVLGLGLYQRGIESRERARGLEARRELLTALKLTDGKMELAYRALKQAEIGASADN